MPRNQCKGNRGGRRQRVMSFLQPCLLLMLTRGPAHGYSLLDGIAQFGFERECFDASLIYRALRDMEDFGWVESQWQDESQGPRRRVYQILPDGKRRLSEWVDELHRTRDEIDALLEAYKQAHQAKVS
jgi:PadR family transcriptional regulator, regulatory protein PadR